MVDSLSDDGIPTTSSIHDRIEWRLRRKRQEPIGYLMMKPYLLKEDLRNLLESPLYPRSPRSRLWGTLEQHCLILILL